MNPVFLIRACIFFLIHRGIKKPVVQVMGNGSGENVRRGPNPTDSSPGNRLGRFRPVEMTDLNLAGGRPEQSRRQRRHITLAGTCPADNGDMGIQRH